MSNPLLTSFLFTICYVIGALPSGKILARLWGVDIEKVGSGNVGATNVARTAGKLPGVLTLCFDIGKGLSGVFLGTLIESPQWGGILTVFGHCFSIPTLLKGGKGVATSLGVLIALSPLYAAVVAGVFVVMIALSKKVSFASIIAALSLPVGIVIMEGWENFSLTNASHHSVSLLIGLLMAGVVVYRHHTNIRRLIDGTEPSFHTKKLVVKKSSLTS
jgi:acyl phosphate:glycerol-3-phosphate acyltransferase